MKLNFDFQVAWAHPRFGSILASCSYDRKIILWREDRPGNISNIFLMSMFCFISCFISRLNELWVVLIHFQIGYRCLEQIGRVHQPRLVSQLDQLGPARAGFDVGRGLVGWNHLHPDLHRWRRCRWPAVGDGQNQQRSHDRLQCC